MDLILVGVMDMMISILEVFTVVLAVEMHKIYLINSSEDKILSQTLEISVMMIFSEIKEDSLDNNNNNVKSLRPRFVFFIFPVA